MTSQMFGWPYFRISKSFEVDPPSLPEAGQKQYTEAEGAGTDKSLSLDETLDRLRFHEDIPLDIGDFED